MASLVFEENQRRQRTWLPSDSISATIYLMRPAVSFTSYLPRLPFDFFYWWFFEATVNLIKVLTWIFKAFLQLLSLDSIFKTFFKPWKNEYREGLTRFSIFFGVGFKSAFLVFDVFLLAAVLFIEAAALVAWLALPLIVIWGVYAQIFS